MGQTHNKYGAWPYDMRQATQGLLWLPIAASQTLTKGDFVILSSGLVQIALANSAELAGVIAADQATPTASTLVPVYADPNTVFEIIADADSSGLTAGSAPGIVGTTGAMMLDVGDDNATNVLTCLRVNPDDTNTDAYARWLVKIAKHAFADLSS